MDRAGRERVPPRRAPSSVTAGLWHCAAMQLRAGFTFTVAARFYSDRSWVERLEINGGVQSNLDGVFPRQDWRRLTSGERAILVAEEPRSGSAAALAPAEVSVFTVPEHLRDGWWVVAEDVGSPEGNAAEYERFVVATLEFLNFKALPLPERCRFDLVARAPGQDATRIDDAGRRLGVSPDSRSGSHDRLVAAINLGDELSHLTVLNLGLREMRAMLDESSAEARAIDETSRLFFSDFPTYPLVRVGLAPCEGLWLPESAIVWHGDTRGKQEPDIVLLIRAEQLPLCASTA